MIISYLRAKNAEGLRTQVRMIDQSGITCCIGGGGILRPAGAPPPPRFFCCATLFKRLFFKTFCECEHNARLINGIGSPACYLLNKRIITLPAHPPTLYIQLRN